MIVAASAIQVLQHAQAAGNPTEQASAADPWVSLILPIFIAALGLLGVFAGAVIAARSALRVRVFDSNREEAAEQRAFFVRTVASVNKQTITLARIVSFYEDQISGAIQSAPAGATKFQLSVKLDDELVARLRRADEEWRGVLAESHLFASNDLFESLESYDHVREELVIAINAGLVPDARSALDRLIDVPSMSIYQHIQLGKIQGSLALINTLRTRRLRRALNETHARISSEYAAVTARVNGLNSKDPD